MNIKELFQNEKGSAMVKGIMTAALVAGSLVFVTKVSQRSSKTIEAGQKKGDVSSLNLNVSRNVKKMFLEAKGLSGQNTQGACSFVKVSSTEGIMASAVYNLPDLGKRLFSDKRWQEKFAGFRIASDKDCEEASTLKNLSGYEKCFRPDLSKAASLPLSVAELKKLDPVIKVVVFPVQTNPLADSPFSAFEPNKGADGKEIRKRGGFMDYDVKSVGFSYRIESVYSQNKSRRSSLLEGFVWPAGELANCQLGGKYVALTAGGPGDISGSMIYSAGGFTEDSGKVENQGPIKVDEVYSQVQSGKLLGSGLTKTITSDENSFVYSSCNERRFQCPQLGADNKREYEELRLQMRLAYQTPNSLKTRMSRLNFVPKISFQSSNGEELGEFGVDSAFLLDNARYHENKDGTYRSTASGGSQISVAGEHTLEARVFDKTDKNSANNLCREICVESTGYNTEDAGKVNPIFSYKANISNEYDKDGNKLKLDYDHFQSPVACTSLYMKNGGRFGLGTFGPMSNSPTEPLDAGLPECVRHESEPAGGLELSYMGRAKGNKCVALRLNRDEMTGFTASAEDCGERKNILCFNFGKHFLAKELTSSGASLASAAHNQGRQKCFETGREIINGQRLGELFLQQGFSLQPTQNIDSVLEMQSALAREFLGLGNTINLVNLAAQGSFLSPVGKNQERSLRRHNEKTMEIGRQNFWVGLKTDNMGSVYAPAPILPSGALGGGNKWSLAYDPVSERLVPQKHEVDLGLSVGSGKQAALLYHHVRYKGIAFANDKRPLGRDSEKGELRFLCASAGNDKEVFVSKERSDKAESGHRICKEEGGVFLPPLTTKGWIEAFHQVKENHPRASYPLFRVEDRYDYDPVWVALENSGSISIYKGSAFQDLFSGERGWRIDSKGRYLSSSDGGERFSYALCFNEREGSLELRGSCDKRGEWRNLKEDELDLIGAGGNRVIQKQLIALLSQVRDGSVIQVLRKPEKSEEENSDKG